MQAVLISCTCDLAFTAAPQPAGHHHPPLRCCRHRRWHFRLRAHRVRRPAPVKGATRAPSTRSLQSCRECTQLRLSSSTACTDLMACVRPPPCCLVITLAPVPTLPSLPCLSPPCPAGLSPPAATSAARTSTSAPPAWVRRQPLMCKAAASRCVPLLALAAPCLPAHRPRRPSIPAISAAAALPSRRHWPGGRHRRPRHGLWRAQRRGAGGDVLRRRVGGAPGSRGGLRPRVLHKGQWGWAGVLGVGRSRSAAD